MAIPISKEWLVVKHGETTILTAQGVSDASDNQDILVSALAGWRASNVNITTTPKLFGEGDYLAERSVPSKDVTVTLHFFLELENTFEILEIIKEKQRAFELFTFELHLRGGGRVETLKGYIKTVGEPARYLGGRTDVELSFIAVDPAFATEIDPDWELPTDPGTGGGSV